MVQYILKIPALRKVLGAAEKLLRRLRHQINKSVVNSEMTAAENQGRLR